MNLRWKTNKDAIRGIALLAAILVFPLSALAVDQPLPSSVDIYWLSTKAISAPGVTGVVILDEEIAHAELASESIVFAGVSRGDTVALVYVNGAPVSVVIHVIEHPVKAISPSMLRRQAELAHGTYGSELQTSNSTGNSTWIVLNSFAWSQQVADNHLDVNTQVEDNSQIGGHFTNVRTGTISYRTPHLLVNAIDFSESLDGSNYEDRINNFSSPTIMQMRGAGVTFLDGKNQFSFFGGTTIPYYFLSLNATRDIAGFSFHRNQTDRLNFFGSTSYANIPTTYSGPSLTRRDYVMQTAGFRYLLSKHLSVGVLGGGSNRGGLLRADMGFTSFRTNAYATVISASQTFPLNQLQSLFSGSSSVKGGVNYRISNRLTQGFYFEHTNLTPGPVYHVRGNYDYFSPTLGFTLSKREALNFSYARTTNSGGFAAGSSTGNRYDVTLNSQLAQRTSNTAQVSIGSIQDPLQINSQDEFTIRDAISLPIKKESLQLGFEQHRVQASLVQKLNQELSLLSPDLQTQFLANPVAFIDSPSLPPEIKALLAAEQPTGTTLSASATIGLGKKLQLNPNFSVTHAANTSRDNAWSDTFGYSLSYQLRPTLQLRSSLSNVLFWNAQQNSAQRTTVLSVGLQKNFTAAPNLLLPAHRSRLIEGRVFRDNNVNGAFNLGEPGLPGVQIRLDDGQSVSTDEQGRYRFSGVSADQHQVSLDLAQFHNPIRMTTKSEAEADMIQQRIVAINFGILDFARVMGSVFNDLRFEGKRQPDSKGMQGLDMLLEGGKETLKASTSSSGEFEIDNVPPGDYKLSIDVAGLPANYNGPKEPISIHVSPVSTVVQDIPMRALRSISGRVLLKVPKNANVVVKNDSLIINGVSKPVKRRGLKLGQKAPEPSAADADFTLLPIAGVQLRANSQVVRTDDNGNFLLRNLPAGPLQITVVPARAVPDDIKLPSGQLEMPTEPVQIEGATIIVSNADLVPYLTRILPGSGITVAELEIREHEAALKRSLAPVQESRTSPLAPISQPNAAKILPPKAQIPASAPLVAAVQVVPAPAIVAQPLKSVLNLPKGQTESTVKCDPSLSLGEIAACYRARKAPQSIP